HSGQRRQLSKGVLGRKLGQGVFVFAGTREREGASDSGGVQLVAQTLGRPNDIAIESVVNRAVGATQLVVELVHQLPNLWELALDLCLEIFVTGAYLDAA